MTNCRQVLLGGEAHFIVDPGADVCLEIQLEEHGEDDGQIETAIDLEQTVPRRYRPVCVGSTG